MNNEMKVNNDSKPNQINRLSDKNFYKINIIKVTENNKNDEEKDNEKDKGVLKSFRKYKSINTKNILENSCRSRKSSFQNKNEESKDQQSKKSSKNIFAQVRKSNINSLHNKSIIFEGNPCPDKKKYCKYNSHTNNNNSHFLNLLRFTNNLYEKEESLKPKILNSHEINECLQRTPILERKNVSKDKILKLNSLKNQVRKQLSLNLMINDHMKKSNAKIKSSKFLKTFKNEKDEKSRDNSSSINQSVTAYYKVIGNSSKQSLFFIPDKNNNEQQIDINNNNIIKSDKENNGKLIVDNKKDKNNKDIKNKNKSPKKEKKAKKENNEKDNNKKKEKQINNINIFFYNDKNKEKDNNQKSKDKNKDINSGQNKNDKKKDKDNNENTEKQTNYSSKKINNIKEENNYQTEIINKTKKTINFMSVKNCFFCCLTRVGDSD